MGYAMRGFMITIFEGCLGMGLFVSDGTWRGIEKVRAERYVYRLSYTDTISS